MDVGRLAGDIETAIGTASVRRHLYVLVGDVRAFAPACFFMRASDVRACISACVFLHASG